MLTEKDYCDYETCVALKELGFNQYHSDRVYAGEGGVWTLNFEGEPNYNEGELIRQEDLFGVPRDGNEVAAPSLYEAQKWLREEKGIIVDVSFSPFGYFASIYTNVRNVKSEIPKERFKFEWSKKLYGEEDHDSYGGALLEGLIGAVKILKEK